MAKKAEKTKQQEKTVDNDTFVTLGEGVNGSPAQASFEEQLNIDLGGSAGQPTAIDYPNPDDQITWEEAAIESQTRTQDDPEFQESWNDAQDEKNNRVTKERDVRLKGIYNKSLQIGNDMPIGEDFLGIPSIMNSHALIRFEGIVGPEEHIDVYDWEGNYKVRNARTYSVTYNVSDTDSTGKDTIFKDNKNGTVSYTGNDENILKQIKGHENNLLIDDVSGDIYYEDIVPNTYIYENKTDKNKLINGSDELILNIKLDEGKTPPGKASDDSLIDQVASMLDPSLTRKSNGETTTGTTGQTAEGENNTNTTQEGSTSAEGSSTNPGEGNSSNPPSGSATGINGSWTLTSVIGSKIESQKENDAIKRQLATQLNILSYAQYYTYKGPQKSKVFVNRAQTDSAVYSNVIEPTVENLCNTEMWIGDEQFMYEYSDFIYCTDFEEQISNNYLITLRRFPMPVWDNGKIADQNSSREHMTPIARAVTWTTDEDNKLEDILKMSWKYKWKPMTAEVNSVQDNTQDQGADLNNIPKVGKAISTMGKVFDFLGGGNPGARDRANGRAQYDPYSNGPMSGQPQGPVNSINTTMMRDVGLEYDNNITLKFKYSLKSIGAINAKKAALDIIANMLSLTYSNAGFWGGANRFFKKVHNNYFSNDKSMMKAFNDGNLGGMLSAFKSQFENAFKSLGDLLNNLVSNPAEALKGLLKQGAKFNLQQASAKSRPGILSFKSLLTGEPVGDWHLVIGNPFNPTAMIGNLIVESCELSFGGGQLGPDDFPQQLIFTISLKHGKPRDKGDIESIFNQGQGRLHYAYRGNIEPWNQKPNMKRYFKQGGTVSGQANLSNQKTSTKTNQNVDTSFKSKPHPVDTYIFNQRKTGENFISNTEYWKTVYNRNSGPRSTADINSYKQTGALATKNVHEDEFVQEDEKD